MRFHFLLLAAALLAGGCSGGEGDPAAERSPAEPAALSAVPEPDLSAAEEGVREQIAEQRAAAEHAAAAGDAEAAAEAYGELGLVYLTYDFPEAAGVALGNAAALAPGDFRWPYLEGYLALVQGDLAAGVPLLEAAFELAPDYLPAVLRLGRAELERGNLERAGELFARAHELDSEAPAVHEGLGRVAAERGDDRRAIAHFEQALELASGASSLHYALGQAYRRAGDLERARFHLERSGDAPVPIEDPAIRPMSLLGESLQFLLVQGGESVEKGDFETAAAAYERALERHPESFLARKGMAFSLTQLGDPEAGIEHLEEALATGSSGDPARDRREKAEIEGILASLAADRGDDATAVAHFRRSLALRPHTDTRMKLADALARRGRFEEAIAEYDRVLADDPPYRGHLLGQRATALVNLGRHPEALADFRRALEATPDDAALRARYAEALSLAGRRDEAEREREALAATSDSSDEVRRAVLAARRAVSSGDYEEAVRRYRQALEAEPGALLARRELAQVLGHRGELGEALAEFRKLLDEAPRDPAARRGEITTLVLLGRWGEARMRLHEAMRLFPRDAELAHLQARLLATAPDERVRDGRLAVEVARRLVEVRNDLPARETLALAYAAAGRYREATELGRRLLAEAEARGATAIAARLREELSHFERNEGWVAATPDDILGPALGAAG